MTTDITRPLCGRDVRMYFTPRGKLRFVLPDLLDALVPNHRTKPTLKKLAPDHIRPRSRNDDTETIDWDGLMILAFNTGKGRGLQYVEFLKHLPKRPDTGTAYARPTAASHTPSHSHPQQAPREPEQDLRPRNPHEQAAP